MLQLTILRKLLPACGLIVVFSAPLGCLYEAAQQPYIVEVELKDESIRRLPATPGPMLRRRAAQESKAKRRKPSPGNVSWSRPPRGRSGGCRFIRFYAIGRKSEWR